MENYIKCPYNGEYFKPKRSNQKYASKYNRVAFHNRKYRELKMPLEKPYWSIKWDGQAFSWEELTSISVPK